MTAVNLVTDLSTDGEVSVITLNSPPVNALSQAVREGLDQALRTAFADARTKAVVVICEGRTFIAGADISEFGEPRKPPGLKDVQQLIESSPKPVVAAIHGTALGGGLEVALCATTASPCRRRAAACRKSTSASCRARGGTQRLPRIVGVEKALEMMTSGQHVPAKECLAMGLVDELVEEGN